jgi:hypothetical protein
MQFRVDFPQAGEKAFLQADMAALDGFYDRYGDGWVKRLFAGLRENDIGPIKIALSALLKEGEVDHDAIIESMVLSELSLKLSDALSLKIHGTKVSDFLDAPDDPEPEDETNE